MAEANLPSTKHIASLDKSALKIDCIVCKKARCYTKYRRHLLTHAERGRAAQAKDVNEIMFRCRSTRCDINSSAQKSGSRLYYSDL